MDAYPLDEQDLCSICRENLTNFDSVYSFGSYEGTLRKLIHLYKYGKVETLDMPLSRFVLRAVPLDQEFDLVIGMPMHWRKQWERGFNQAELLARPLAKRYGLKVSRNLTRRRYTKAQAGLTEAERRENLKDSFGLRKPEQVRGKRVLVVDDVFTTGATLRSAAGVLKGAGALHVTAVTLARADRRSFEQNSVPDKQTPVRAVRAGSGLS